MRNANAGRRRKAESIAPDRRPPPPTPNSAADNWQFLSTPVPSRDSDASFCSSRPSIAASVLPNITDRSYQLSALRTINSYLTSQSFPVSLKHPLPSAKDITETLKFLVQRLGFGLQKLDEDLNYVLKFMKCPLKLNKSALRAPGTPHSWPNLLAVIHWLVQIIKYKEYMMNSSPSFEADQQFLYTIKSYSYYIRGDDEAVEALDESCMREMTEWKAVMEDEVNGLEDTAKDLVAKLEGLKGPSRKEVLEQDKSNLEKDMMKFHVLIERLDGNMADAKRKLEEKEKALEEKVEHRKRICEENEELKRKIEEQVINLRDAERMKRELQAVERDIEELEATRSGWEEKMWELDSNIGHRFKELERLAMDCNQAIRRLKLGNGFQYQLDANGSTPSKVLGLDYKSILKPELASFAGDIKGNSMEKLQEVVSLRQKSSEYAAKLEEKRNRVDVLQSHIDGVDAQLISIKKRAHENASKCAAKARKMAEEVGMDEHKLSIVQNTVTEFLQTSEAQLQETIAQTEEEVKLCAQETFQMISSVSTYKEHMRSRIVLMRNDLLETASAVAGMYKGYSNPSSKRPDSSTMTNLLP